MQKLIGTLIILGGLTGLFMIYKDYAKKNKEGHNTWVDEISRVIADTSKAKATDADDLAPWYAGEGAVFRILALLHGAETDHYSVDDTLNSAISSSGMPKGQGKLVAARVMENYRIVKSLKVFEEVSNAVRMENGNAPVARSKGWEDEKLTVGHLVSPLFAPEASQSLVNLVVMPASVRQMQSDDMNSFSYELSRKWLQERIITPDSHRKIEDYFNEHAKRP